ncbi:MAG: hypothetical protein IJ242_03955 [Clostridia bacterium]|nr:hypothetical protein [Clostridia bacterium]
MRSINFEVLIIAFVAASFLWTFFRIIRVKMLGVEVNAVVTRLEEHETTDADGIPNEYYEAYIRYQTQDGRTVNASLANSNTFLNIGDWVRIKYIPGQEDYPVLAGIL